MSAEYLAFLMMEGRQSDMLPYAQLLLDMREMLAGMMKGCPCYDAPCLPCALLARADEILRTKEEADCG